MLISLESLKSLLKSDDKNSKRPATKKAIKKNEEKLKSLVYEEISRSVPNSSQLRSNSFRKSGSLNANLLFNQSSAIVGLRNIPKKQQTIQLSQIFLNNHSNYIISNEDASVIEKNYPTLKKLLDFSESEYREHFHVSFKLINYPLFNYQYR